jgi:methionyl-tRNA formyltransferase
MTGRVGTVFLGTGTFAVPVLEALARAPGVDIRAVVTAPSRPSGRGGRLTPSPVATAAATLGLEPVLAPDRLRRPEAVADVLALDPGLLVLADYGQIVPSSLLGVPHGALNLHPSLLPRHRGASPVQATILAGDPETGVTLMRMDEGVDTGPIVAQVGVALDGSETAPALEAALAAEAGALLVATLPEWLAGRRHAAPQPADGATLTRPLRREDGRLDPSKGAAALERQVRAYQPWPGTWFETPDGRLTLWQVRTLALGGGFPAALPPRGDETPVLLPDGDGLALAVSDGALRLDEVQLAGGRRMTGDELRRGHPGLLRPAKAATGGTRT